MPRHFTFNSTAIWIQQAAIFWASLTVNVHAEWQVSTIDSLANNSRNPGIAIDSSGTVHVAYYADLGSRVAIKYAKQVGSSWEIQTVAVERMSSSGDRVRIEIDSLFRPHIVYQAFTSLGGDRGVMHAVPSGGSWNISMVHPTTIRGRVPDIALDASDNPHVVVHDNGGLGYGSYHSFFDGASWQTEPITANPNQAFGGILLSTIGVDSQDTIHAAGNVGGSIYYANNNSGSWMNQTTSPNPVDNASMVIDSLDQPVIGYHNLDDNSIGISVRTEAGWQHDVLTSSTWRAPVSLALGQNDRRFLTFYDDDGVNRQLQYATYHNGWQFETIDTFPGVSSSPIGASLALHPDGTPYVVYGDEPRGLRIAVRVPEPTAGTLLLMTAGIFVVRRTIS